MKTNRFYLAAIFVLLLLCSSRTLGQTYQYTPFPDSFAVWYEQYEVFCSDPGSFVRNCNRWIIDGDTVINGQDYNKLYLFDDSIYKRVFYGGLYEDSLRRVYLYWADSSAKYLLYDYSVDVGDTVFFTPLGDTIWINITSIDTVFRFGRLRRSIYFNYLTSITQVPYDEYNYLEGIGGSKGLLYFINEMDFLKTQTCGFFKLLMAFSTMDTSMSVECIDTVGLDDIGIGPNVEINIHPNPSQEFIHVSVSNSVGAYQVVLWNLWGKQLFRLPCKSDCTIDARSFSKGVYLIEVRATSGAYRYRTKILIE